ncbi:hypothetical protein [Methylobacterium radiodurans]|uniref:Uncharacterized protein n=1 Tax=Methylobacterium radiodurans TaxID=2202828 RepID=A0A2U8VUJ9_9HYPH|nr:hypothetical protein [Methylobacterium radiodurans]AWN36922.1 hypothetical protein DK427_15245 [Methylobacterium radiodurans]
MNFQSTRHTDEPQGRATFGMAKLRSRRTGLPFIVFISRRDGARHDVRGKVSPNPKVRNPQMGSHALRPYRFVDGCRLNPGEERAPEAWVGKNLDVLVRYWNGDIEYTEDALGLLEAI